MRQVNVHEAPGSTLAVVGTVATPGELHEWLQSQETAAMVKLGARLLELQLITREQLDRALKIQRAGSTRHLGQVLTDLGYLTQTHLRQVVCEQLGIPFVVLEHFPVEPGVLSLVPEKTAREYSVLPLCCIEGRLFLAMSDPLDAQALERARFCAQRVVVPVMAHHHEIDRAIRALYQPDVIAFPPIPFESPPALRSVAERSTAHTDGAFEGPAAARVEKHSSLQVAVVETIVSPEQLRERLSRQHATAMLKVGARLVELGLVSSPQLEHALRLQRHDPARRLGHVLLSLGFISEAHLKQVVCEQLGIPFVAVEKFPADRAVLRMLPDKSVREFRMLPLCCIESRLVVAMSDPLNVEAVEHARFCARMAIMPVMALGYEIEHAIRALYGDRAAHRVRPRERVDRGSRLAA